MRHAAVAMAIVGEGDAQACDRDALEAGRGIEHRADLDAREPQPARRPDDSRTHRNDGCVSVREVSCHRERAVDRYRFVVAAERVAARDRRVEQVVCPHLRDEIGQRERKRGAVGHHVRDAAVGTRTLERGRDRRHLAVQGRGDHRHAPDRGDVDHLGPVLLGAADVGLDARVARLDDVARTRLRPIGAGEVPMHDVPAARAEPELDCGGVDDDLVAGVDAACQLRQHVRALGAGPEVDLDPLQSGPLVEEAADRARPKRWHERAGRATGSRSAARPAHRAP